MLSRGIQKLIYTQDREQLRQFWCTAWQKARNHQNLEPLEQLIVQIVIAHPEYHAVLENFNENNSRDWLPIHGESNPFLHLGMHLALQESLATNRPYGIKEIYISLINMNHDSHHTEHLMMECLAEVLWQAQRNQQSPQEINFLNCLKNLLNN